MAATTISIIVHDKVRTFKVTEQSIRDILSFIDKVEIVEKPVSETHKSNNERVESMYYIEEKLKSMGSRVKKCSVVVQNIASTVRDKDLFAIFGRYGGIEHLDHMRNQAVITYSDFRDAEDAVRDTDGTRLGDNRVVVVLANKYDIN